MSDEQDTQRPLSEQPENAEQPEDAEQPAPTGAEQSATEPEEHTFKESARDTVAKVVGRAVELGSILGGEGGNIVEAQREVAEAETEDLIDRIDGEG